jgi:hypothetical protein
METIPVTRLSYILAARLMDEYPNGPKSVIYDIMGQDMGDEVIEMAEGIYGDVDTEAGGGDDLFLSGIAYGLYVSRVGNDV